MADSAEREYCIQLGEKIKAARQNCGLTQEELGTMLGLTRTSIVNIEKGRQSPPLFKLSLMANFLQVSITDLLPENQVRVLSPEVKTLILQRLAEIESSNHNLMHFFTSIPGPNERHDKHSD